MSGGRLLVRRQVFAFHLIELDLLRNLVWINPPLRSVPFANELPCGKVPSAHWYGQLRCEKSAEIGVAASKAVPRALLHPAGLIAVRSVVQIDPRYHFFFQ